MKVNGIQHHSSSQEKVHYDKLPPNEPAAMTEVKKKFPRIVLIFLIAGILVAAAIIGLYLYGGSAKGYTQICNVINSSSPAPGIANSTSKSPTATEVFSIVDSDP